MLLIFCCARVSLRQFRFGLDGYETCKDTIRNELNCVGFAREKAQTMSFVERGFERLGPDRQVVGFSWCSFKVK